MEKWRDAGRPNEGSRLGTQWEAGGLEHTLTIGIPLHTASSLILGLPRDISDSANGAELSCSLLQPVGDCPVHRNVKSML